MIDSTFWSLEKTYITQNEESLSKDQKRGFLQPLNDRWVKRSMRDSSGVGRENTWKKLLTAAGNIQTWV